MNNKLDYYSAGVWTVWTVTLLLATLILVVDFMSENNRNNSKTDLDAVTAEVIRSHTTFGLPDPKLYPPVAVAKLAEKDGWVRPRALIHGKVTMVKKEDDGDEHFRVEGVDADSGMVVCEIIPEIPLKEGKPKVGDVIHVWGVARWDGEHKWGELHPVVGWRK